MRFSHRAAKAVINRTLVAVAAGFVLWLVVALQLFVNVAPFSVYKTDAVIMLGGDSEDRLPAARALQEQFGIPVLVLAETGLGGNYSADQFCDSVPQPNAGVICFRPRPLNTRGEAEAISTLIEHNGWKSVSVVTSNFHVTRADRLIKQCTTADVQMVPAPASMTPGEWLWRFVVETGGLLDATFRPQCASPSGP